MPKLSEETLKELTDIFGYSNLMERYRVLEELFDIKEGDIVVDGGSYHGDMAIYFSKKVGDSGKVYCIEPLAYNCRQLRRLIAYRRLDNVKVIPFALWDRSEIIPFYLSKYSNAGSPVKEFRKVITSKTETIGADSLDNIVKDWDIPKVDYIWMNIEGSEIRALRGMKKTLKKNNCKLCISTHRVTETYANTNDVRKLLESYGYKTDFVINHIMWVTAEK